MSYSYNKTKKMSFLGFFIIFFALVFLFSPLALSKGLQYPIIRVDKSGRGNFSTIQAAIDSVPSNNMRWVCISVSAGVYREKIKIPVDKQFIILKGKGKRTTVVEWADHQNIAESPTFLSEADNTIVKTMTFVNSYNSPINLKQNPRVPAVAVSVMGDKTSFYRVGFSGLQDTLWDSRGRHYFFQCTIQGAVDFIFGGGQSIYRDCSIQVRGGELQPGASGFITAQGRANNEDTNGFVFKNCRVLGTGSAFLGRPWRAYARVIFYKSTFSSIIQPQGWERWRSDGVEDSLTYAEYDCKGPGADTSRRVGWEKKLSEDMVLQFTNMKFIDSEGWLSKQPL